MQCLHALRMLDATSPTLERQEVCGLRTSGISRETRELDLPFFDLLYRIANCTIVCTPRLSVHLLDIVDISGRSTKNPIWCQATTKREGGERPPSRGAKSAL
mgnify:CR=1 FL=1